MAKERVRKSSRSATIVTVMEPSAAFEPVANGVAGTESRQQIESLAYALWQARGCPDGSPETDWYGAEQQLLGGNELIVDNGGPKK